MNITVYDLHSPVKVKMKVVDRNGELQYYQYLFGSIIGFSVVHDITFAQVIILYIVKTVTGTILSVFPEDVIPINERNN